MAKSFDIDAHVLGPGEARDLYPMIEHGLIEGAVYIPGDGQTNPVDTTMSLAAGARQLGAQIFENTPVMSIRRLPSGAFQVKTRTASRSPNASSFAQVCGPVTWRPSLAFGYHSIRASTCMW